LGAPALVLAAGFGAAWRREAAGFRVGGDFVTFFFAGIWRSTAGTGPKRTRDYTGASAAVECRAGP
jgi:putative SOS response-associated peptidase YedK